MCQGVRLVNPNLPMAARVSLCRFRVLLMILTAALSVGILRSIFSPISAHAAQSAVPEIPKTAPDVLEVLSTNCAPCHGKRVKDPAADFGFVDDLARLSNSVEYVIKRNPEESLLYKRAGGGGGMPPKGRRPLSDNERTVIRDWIAAGAPVARGETVDAARTFVSDEAILQAMAKDLTEADPKRRVSFRYLTITNLFNAGADSASLDRFREAISKLINSLSWSPNIYRPVAVDENRTVYRLDLEALSGPDGRGWRPETWEEILRRYPYGIDYGTVLANQVTRLTGTTVAFVRADWFAFEATQQPLYNQLIGLPSNATALESRLGVNVRVNILAGHVARAGFMDSGVSANNRLVERHEIAKWRGGYWRSYDFKNSAGARDLRTHPLGPRSLASVLTENSRSAVFEHDGGEVIFSLPNGMQGYMLVDSNENRLEAGPSEVVFDSLKNSTKRGVIVNAVSCMGCHASGMQPAKDEIRNAAASGLSPSLRDAVNQLYPETARLQSLLRIDSERFILASKNAGLTTASLDPRNEPVTSLTKRFTARLRVGDAAAEVGLQPVALLDRLGGELFDIKQALQSSGVAREEFIGRFEAIVRGLRLGDVYTSDVSQATAGRHLRDCDAGDFFRCAALGSAYRDGEGISADPRKAVTLLQRACQGGNAYGCADLGIMYRDSMGGLATDFRKSGELFGKACDAGFGQACIALGNFYEDGKPGIPRDAVQAVALYDRTCDLVNRAGITELDKWANALGCNKLGVAYYDTSDSLGLWQDPAKMVVYWERTCDGGNGFGCLSLATRYKLGDMVTKDLQRAFELYQRGCDDLILEKEHPTKKESCSAAKRLSTK
jgi:TPR repeat protein/mono/diheme cytochrome c family protein